MEEQREKIQEIINKYNLATKSRRQKYVYKRHYLCSYLRSLGYTHQSIGEMLNKKHCTVINCVNKYEDLKNNTYFQSMVVSIEYDLLDADLMPVYNGRKQPQQNSILILINRLFECRDMQDVESLKGFVNENINPNMLR